MPKRLEHFDYTNLNVAVEAYILYIKTRLQQVDSNKALFRERLATYEALNQLILLYMVEESTNLATGIGPSKDPKKHGPK